MIKFIKKDIYDFKRVKSILDRKEYDKLKDLLRLYKINISTDGIICFNIVDDIDIDLLEYIYKVDSNFKIAVTIPSDMKFYDVLFKGKFSFINYMPNIMFWVTRSEDIDYCKYYEQAFDKHGFNRVYNKIKIYYDTESNYFSYNIKDFIISVRDYKLYESVCDITVKNIINRSMSTNIITRESVLRNFNGLINKVLNERVEL